MLRSIYSDSVRLFFFARAAMSRCSPIARGRLRLMSTMTI